MATFRPRFFNHRGVFPRDNLSADRFAPEGIHCTDILHSVEYFISSKTIRKSLPIRLLDRPLISQSRQFVWSVCKITIVPRNQGLKQKTATRHANNSFRAMTSVLNSFNLTHGVLKNRSPQHPPIPQDVAASTKISNFGLGRRPSSSPSLFLYSKPESCPTHIVIVLPGLVLLISSPIDCHPVVR